MALRSYGQPFLATSYHQARNERIAESLRVVPAIQQLSDGGQIACTAIFSHAGVLAVLNDQQARELADAIHDTIEKER